MLREIIQYTLKLLSTAILAKYKPKVVAITGSAGKTSAKEAVYLVLCQKFPGKVRRSQENLNTEIGLPLAIIGGENAKRNATLWLKNFLKALQLVLFKDKNYPGALVLEMAADRPGDIDYLTSFVHPDAAVITAIGEMPSHLEFFLERDEYVSEKANILKNLKPRGAAILNYDDLSVRELRHRVPTDRTQLYYGFQKGAEVEVTDFSYNVPESPEDIEKAGMEFSVSVRTWDDSDSADFKIKESLGLPVVYAAAAGIAVGRIFGVSLGDAAKALLKFKPPPHRLALLKGIKGAIIIDDSYNSSPLAAAAALEVLLKFKKNRRVAVLGSMRELGVNTEAAHRQLGQEAAKAAQVVFLIGEETVFAREELEKKRFVLGQNLFLFPTAFDAAKAVENFLQSGDVVLIKGSRGVKLEAVVEEIIAK